jgi:hypothetical protein
MPYHNVRRGLAIAAVLLISPGCNTPDTVSKFCSSAVTALSSTTDVLSDLGPSCLREVNDNTYELGSFQPPVSSDQQCGEITKQASAAVAAAKLLSEYFSTLNSLATAGTSSASKDANTLASNAAGIAGATSDQKTAFSSIALQLASGVMGAYQYRRLAQDVTKAKKDVDETVAALISAIQNEYVDKLLDDENKKLANPYKAFLSKHDTPEARLSLDERWQADERILEARRSSAQSAVAALQTLQKGFDQLANNANNVKAKDIPGLLGPYVSELQTLIPQIQKAF